MTANLQRLVKRPLVTEWCLDEEEDGDRRLGGDLGLSDLGLGGPCSANPLTFWCSSGTFSKTEDLVVGE